MLSAQMGHSTTAKLLLAAGADPNIPGKRGWTALHFASFKGYLPIVQALAEYEADLDALCDSGDAPAHFATKFNCRDVILFLREKGADFSIKDVGGLTAEDWLQRGGIAGHFDQEFKEFKSSLERQAKSEANVRKMMSEGLSADEYAAKHGRRILVWGYGHDHFDDAELEAWAHRVAEVLFTPGLLVMAEEQFLFGNELEEARKFRTSRARSATREKIKRERQG